MDRTFGQDAITARNEDVVRRFLKGWDDLDVDACMAECTENMTYLNQPLEAIRGRDDVRTMIASIFAPASKCRFEIVNLFGHQNKVITERIDRWDWSGSGTWELELKVCGMFHLTFDGQIYEWSDYYDNDDWSTKGGPSLEM